METRLYTTSEVASFIQEGRVMLLTGMENALRKLPKGKWIGGTSPYFMDTIGKVNDDLIMVDDFTDCAKNVAFDHFDDETIGNLFEHQYANGFTVLVLPFDSAVHKAFANRALHDIPGMFDNPLVGYVSCCHLEDFGKAKTYTVFGADGELSESQAVAMHVELNDGLVARTEIMNFDVIDETTPTIVFPKTSFVQSECTIDGKPANVVDYLLEYRKQRGQVVPLIARCGGALINRDIREIDEVNKTVSFFSPAEKGDEYRMSKPNGDYQKLFNEGLSQKSNVAACFSCTSYFGGGQFEGKSINQNGVYAFGEIGYQLLNKTIVTLEIDKM